MPIQEIEEIVRQIAADFQARKRVPSIENEVYKKEVLLCGK